MSGSWIKKEGYWRRTFVPLDVTPEVIVTQVPPHNSSSEIDDSLEDFLTTLYACINGDNIQNSYKDFEYKILTHKNKLYQAIESYKENGTIFYSKYITDYPKITIKHIREIKIGENVYCKGRGAYPDGTYYLKFTVYYEKKFMW